MNCSRCQAETTGAYCATCGAPAAGAACRQCKAPLIPGARFCTGCGTAVRAATSHLPWYLAGAALTALLVVLLAPSLRPGATMGPGPAAGFPGSGAPMANRAAPLTGTPREQADRLFNRVMQAQAQGDNDQVAFFLPMAVLAYRQAGELDADGFYHLSLLETASGDPSSGLATAESILRSAPTHLLALIAAAQASDALGDQTGARRHYTRFLEAFSSEREKALPEYMDHAGIFTAYQEEAERYVGR
jgi:hypothetical protein